MRSIFVILAASLVLTSTTQVRAADPPPNNNFTNRFMLAGSSLTVTGYNVGATKETGEPTIKYDNGGSNSGGKSVWWAWTPTSNGTARITVFGSSFDTIMAVYTGTALNSLVWVTGNDDAGSGVLQSFVTFNATAGTQYQITVDGWTAASGNIVLNMHLTNSPPSIYLASPTNGATYTVPATLPLIAFASDFLPTLPWPDGVTNVDFYQDGVQIKRGFTNTTSPTLFTNSVTLGVGTYNFSAASYNRSGQTNLSSPATVNVLANVAPTVSLTSPSDGASFFAPVSIPLVASASDLYNGTITNVEFYTNSVKLAQDTTAPYSNYWSNVAPGTYTLTAKAWDNGGLSTVSGPVTITVNPNVAPTVSITNPIGGATFPAPATIAINAIASDNPGGSITNVEFYQGAAKLGQDTAAPYNFTWSNVVSGTYTLTATAWDNGGLSTVSAPIIITVNPNSPPTVSLNSPPNNSSFVAPASIALIAAASDPDGTVTNVEFYANGAEIGQDTSNPYAIVWNNVTPNNYTLTAVAYDNAGAMATSAPVAIVVSNSAPPVVSITSPVESATFTAGLDLAMLAEATDSDGTVTKVEFFQGAAKLGEVISSPYNFTWSNVVAGSYSLTAVATDNSGTKGTSGVVHVTIGALASWQTNLVPGESIWKYLDNGSDQGTAWRGLNFNDGSWASGKAQLGYGDGDEVTVVGYGIDPNNKYITTYFRRSLFLTNVYRFTNLSLRVIRDDGAAVYINSNEVFRSNMPDGAPNYLALAPLAIGGADENITWYSTNFTPAAGLLRNGANVIAVEIHQCNGTSTDISFDLELTGDMIPATNQLPAVALTYPTPGSIFFLPVTITNAATASDVDGTVTNVDFYANGLRLGRDRTSPYALNWVNPTAGGYTLVAVAFDNNGATNTSVPVNITVVTGVPPTVTLIAPTNGAIFNGPTNLLLQANAADSDGSVARVEFFHDTTSLGYVTAGPFQITWTNAIAGSYSLRAVATDNTGLTTTSAPVAITITTGGMLSTWVAFNDHSPDPNGVLTSPNATTLNCFGNGASVTLKNILDGSTLPATMTVSITGALQQGSTADVPAAGTPLANAFDGFVYFGTGTTPAAAIQTPATATLTLTFSGLDPNKRYKFQGGAVRGNNYFDRWTLMDIVGANSLTPNHQQGASSPWGYLDAIRVPSGAGAPTGFQVAMNFGENRCGDMLEYDNIDPGPDGAFAITCTRYQGPVPAGYGTSATAGDSIGTSTYTYSISGIRLEEFSVSGPFVALTSPTNNQICVLPGNVQMNANVGRFSGTVTNVAFYNWPAKLGDDTSAPYSFTWTNPAVGVYSLRAVASDNTGVIATSAPVSIRVQNNAPPSVAITDPSNGSIITAPTDLTITASASDPDDGVASVAFFANGAPLGQINLPPFSFTWPNVPLGTYDLTAVATDHQGASSTSSVVRVFVIVSTAPTVASFDPPPGVVHDLTQVTVQFNEPVDGVDASDLLINGVPATSVLGANDTYTFSFARPLEGAVAVSWALNHGIVDRESLHIAFNGLQTGETAQYTLIDTLPPFLVKISPIPGATLPALDTVEVTFSEPVLGLQEEDLLINGVPATKASGSLAGPYQFKFAQPANGLVQMSWSGTNGIHDLAVAQNAFVVTNWSYTLDTNLVEANVVINEIYYHPPSENPAEEWLELYNKGASVVNLTGWHFSKGIDFTFPGVSIAPGGYLAVAADLPTFNNNYSEVGNVVGGWSGGMKKHLELQDAAGNVVNDVHFNSGGEWGERLYGSGEKLALSVTRSGSTAHVTIDNYSSSDTFVISGADQPEYNGTFGTSGSTYTGFNYAISGTPVSPATGTIIVRQITDWGKVGWAWGSRADGLGSSLELINPNLPNAYGQNWRANNLNGTPGQGNTAARTNIAPIISEVQHFPLVPRSTNTITITARILDEHTTGLSATLWWRVDALSPPAFSSTPMYDDGAHGDGLAGDGIYGAILAPQANNAVIEFYVLVQDSEGNSRTWPAPALDQNRQPMAQASSPNALLQVDNNAANYYDGVFPVYKLILRAADTNYLVGIPGSAPRSDASMNLTFICLDGTASECIYLCDVRDRGAGTRSRQPCNWRLAFPADHQWRGLNSIELNTQYTHAQLAGYAVSAQSGLNAEWGRVVKLRFNNTDRASSGSPQYSVYIQLQPTDHAYALSHFPEDSDGNLYRAQAPGILGGTIHNDTLAYLGANGASYANQGYSKQSGNNDWSDLANLCAVLNTNTADDAVYAAAVRQAVNVEEWMRYFAVFTLTMSRETSFATGQGDDYSMYRGVKDPRFMLLAHDYDTIFNEGDTTGGYTDSIFRMCPAVNSGANTTVLNRFMRHPEFVPYYYRELKRLSETVFSAPQLAYTFQNVLGSFVPQATINNMVTFGANRANYVLSQIPLQFTFNTGLGQSNGYYYTTTPTLTLNGQANAIDTRSVTVNGTTGGWSAYLGRWTNMVSLQPGINRLLIESRDTNGVAFASTNIDVWYDRGATTTAGGAISVDTVWSPANGPYNVTSSLNIGSGATLTIQPGTSVYLGSGVNITVANGGRLLAEGTAAAPIHFTRTPGTTASWGGITINGAAGSPETRLSYVQIEFNGTTAIHSSSGTLFLDHLTFGTTLYQYFSLDSSSFIVQNSVFPTPTAAFEPGHGTGGVKSGGHGIFLRNFFGAPNGYNDVVDFTGGNRPGQPLVQFIDNVLMGSGDDGWDLDGTDAWVEGNIFLHFHKNGSPDTSSGVSSGDDSGNTSEITILNNIFFDCDQAAMAKQGNFFTLFNNTVVHQTHIGGTDTAGAVVCVADAGTAEARGMYLEGNIIYDVEDLVRNQTAAIVTFTNNLMSLSWAGPGGNNTIGADPIFKHLPQLSETYFTSWAQAQVMKDWLSLKTGSPAIGTGPNGLDKGAVVPLGVSITGEPQGLTTQSNAILAVGINRRGSGIPTAGWPDGSGYTHFKWRLNAGGWSAETSVTNPITLTGLAMGPHQVEVVGKRDTGIYQDDALNGVEAAVSYSRQWIVNPSAISLRLNEVLAWNDSAVPVAGKYPDLIELYNNGPGTIDLSGMSITDERDNPAKYVFPPGATLGPNQYLVLYADSESTPLGYHLDFALNKDGDDIYLYGAGQQLLDSVAFGPQVADRSIGRLADGSWGLTVPTFGAKNQAAQAGDAHKLKINEWLTSASEVYPNDFLELYNTDGLPVSLAGLYLTDTPIGAPDKHQIGPLSFIAGSGYAVFNPDGNPSAGLDHLNFKLSSDRGEIALFDANLFLIDYVLYGPQRTDISQGRSPNASTNIAFFATPTPGSPNPAPRPPSGLQLVINEVLAKNTTGLTNTDGGTPAWIELFNPTASAILLADMSLTTNAATPRKYVLPSVLILSGGYVVVLFDPSLPASTNSVPRPNTGFGLPGNGGQVYLYDKLANGGSLLDSIAYGVQANDYSVGRLPSGSTNWSLTLPTPASANLVATTGDRLQLKINEWLAMDANGGSDWFELYNPNPQPVDLSGLYLTDDLSTPQTRQQFQIAPLSFIGNGAYGYVQFWADKNIAAGPDHVNFALSLQGEELGLYAPQDVRIDSLTFLGQVAGVSEGRLPDGSANIVRFPATASPGEANYLPLTNIVINEVLSAVLTNSSYEPAVELLNVSPSPVNLGGWYLSNMKHRLQQYQFTNGATIAPGGYLVVYAYQFKGDIDPLHNMNLDAIHGDQVYLSAADINGNLTGYRIYEQFGPAQPGVSFGRYTNWLETITNYLGVVVAILPHLDFTAMSQPTFGVDNPDGVADFRTGTGAPNAYPLVGPIVFAEIMYHPPDLLGADNVRDEYLRLLNITSNTVPLYDPLYPANTWHVRGGVDFNFPTNVSLGAGRSLLVVGFDPVNDSNSLAGFRAAYPQMDPAIPLYGPYTGKLDNGGEAVEINKPGSPVPAGQLNAGEVPYILAEHVKYNDKAPWDAQADGTGKSLQRLATTFYGNNPFNWVAAFPPAAQSQDTDGDGIPDWWTQQYFGHPTGQAADQSRASDDADHDGMTNLQEYRAGTDPTDPLSRLRIVSAQGALNNVIIHFNAVASKTYIVEYKDALPASWQNLININPLTVDGAVWVTNQVPQGVIQRFYRVIIPTAP